MPRVPETLPEFLYRTTPNIRLHPSNVEEELRLTGLHGRLEDYKSFILEQRGLLPASLTVPHQKN